MIKFEKQRLKYKKTSWKTNKNLSNWGALRKWREHCCPVQFYFTISVNQLVDSETFSWKAAWVSDIFRCSVYTHALGPKKCFMFAFLRLFLGQWILTWHSPVPSWCLSAPSTGTDCIFQENRAQHKENDSWETNFLPDLASLYSNEEGSGEESVC